MADVKIDFNNCNVSIGKMFDIHDNQNINFITNVPDEKKQSSEKREKKNGCKGQIQQEKQHGLDYPVFSKGSGVTDNHIIAVYRLLTGRGWISTQTSQSEFERLFSGKSNNCEIIWTGQEKYGSNEATKLGISALYVLFKSLYDVNLIISTHKVGPILENHFVDTKGHFLTNISNVSNTSKNATDVINEIIKIMQTRLTTENIKSILQEEMDLRYDKYDRQDLNYRKHH